MNFSPGEIVGLSWMLSGVAVLVTRLLKIGLFGIVYTELQKMHDRRADMSISMIEVYQQMLQERRVSRLAKKQPQLRQVLGLPLTVIMGAVYLLIHILFGPIMFSTLQSDTSYRS